MPHTKRLLGAQPRPEVPHLVQLLRQTAVPLADALADGERFGPRRDAQPSPGWRYGRPAARDCGLTFLVDGSGHRYPSRGLASISDHPAADEHPEVPLKAVHTSTQNIVVEGPLARLADTDSLAYPLDIERTNSPRCHQGPAPETQRAHIPHRRIAATVSFGGPVIWKAGSVVRARPRAFGHLG